MGILLNGLNGMSEAISAANKLLEARPNRQARFAGLTLIVVGTMKTLFIQQMFGFDFGYGLEGVSAVVANVGVGLVVVALGGCFFIYGTRLETRRQEQLAQLKVSGRRRVQRRPTRMEARLLQFVADNPGCHSRQIGAYWRTMPFTGTTGDVMEHIGAIRARSAVDVGWIRNDNDAYTLREEAKQFVEATDETIVGHREDFAE